jgi:hypothetical protein
MYEVIVDEAFARWFEHLAPPLAERVAAAIDFTAGAAPHLDPGKHSRLLLWFDGTSAVSAEPNFQGLIFAAQKPGAWLERYRELLAWQRETLRCLESTEVRGGLQKLSNDAAREALACIAELRSCLAATGAAMGFALARSGARVLGSASELDAHIVKQVENVKRRLEQALSALGLDARDVYDSDGGLREFRVDDVSPQLRLIYGLDVKQQKILALVGDSLERAYYGASVRCAERRWQRYRARQWLTALNAAPQEET